MHICNKKIRQLHLSMLQFTFVKLLKRFLLHVSGSHAGSEGIFGYSALMTWMPIHSHLVRGIHYPTGTIKKVISL